MILVLRTIGITAATVLLLGCTASPTVEKEYIYDITKRHIVEHSNENSYFRPDNSWSHVLDANTAYLNTVASSNILKCEENDIWFISENERAREGKVRYRYTISLAKSQLMKMEDNATNYIPRRDSREFNNLVEINTQMAEEGLIGCSKILSDKEMSKLRLVKGKR